MIGQSGKKVRGKAVLSYRFLFLAIILLLLIMLPYYTSSYTISVFLILLIFLTLSESYDILGGYAGYINLGHGAFLGLGAYAFTLTYLKSFSILLSMIVAGLSGAIFSLFVAYPMFKLKGAPFSIVGISLVLLLQYVFTNLADITGGASGISVPIKATLVPSYYSILFISILSILVHYLISNSKFGLALMCINEDEEVAKIFGVNTFKEKLKAFVISGFFGALAGGAYMHYITYIYPTTVFGLEYSVTPVILAMFGGSGIWYGPIIGSVILIIIQELLWTRLAYFHLFIYGLIMIVIGLFLPGGIVRSSIFKGMLNFFKASSLVGGKDEGTTLHRKFNQKF